jgi:predicted AAA+ superfamily ATPase
VVVCGPRQAGKTTLLKKKYGKLGYFCLDTRQSRDRFEKTPATSWGSTIGNAVIDEVQKSPTTIGKVRFALDQRQIGFCALAGSVDFLSLDRAGEQLANRAKIYELWPLMLCELANMRLNKHCLPLISTILECDETIDAALAPVPRTRATTEEQSAIYAFNHLAKWGGMPALVNVDEQRRHRWLQGYCADYFELDLKDYARQVDPRLLRNFYGAVAGKITKACSYSDLAVEAGIPVTMVRTYLKYLQIALQIFKIEQYSSALSGSQHRRNKIYWSDIGILRSLSVKEPSPNLLFENLIASEIVKWVRTRNSGEKIYFFSAQSRAEVDLVLETASGVIGVQIRNQKEAVTEDIEPLFVLVKAAKTKWLGGMIVTRNKRLRIMDEKRSIWEIPVTRLLGP